MDISGNKCNNRYVDVVFTVRLLETPENDQSLWQLTTGPVSYIVIINCLKIDISENKRYLLLDCLITDIEVEMDPCCVFVVNNTNLNDSTSSSDAADVLIHSTRAALGASREEIQHESHNKVNIYIRRLSDSEDVHSVNEREIPPVHRVNFPSALDTGNTIRWIIVSVT